jgi:hypothetical protein
MNDSQCEVMCNKHYSILELREIVGVSAIQIGIFQENRWGEYVGRLHFVYSCKNTLCKVTGVKLKYYGPSAFKELQSMNMMLNI